MDRKQQLFLSHVQIRLMIMLTQTTREPGSGLIAKIKRYFNITSGWKQVPVYSEEQITELASLANYVRVSCIPGNMEYAAKSFLEARGDPEWIEYDEISFAGNNASVNAFKRFRKQLESLNPKEASTKVH